MANDLGGGVGITLVSHACVVVDTSAGRLMTDPWLRSRAFNDSWDLLTPPAIDDESLREVDWIWISHEHPDHFNVPTLRALPDDVKQRVVILYQENNSDKMIEALHAFGFPNCRRLPHGEVVDLAPAVRVGCYQVGQMDSVLHLAVEGGPSLLNVNDAEINANDCANLVERFGRPDVVLNQFSIAGYDGMPDPDAVLPARRRQILQNMVDNHRDLGASVTVPIASFVYFCAPDNAYINAHMNSPADVAELFAEERLDLKVLAPGDRWVIGDSIDNEMPLAEWSAIYDRVDDLPLIDPPKVVEADLRLAFGTCCDRLHDHHPSLLLRTVSPLVIDVPDIGKLIRLSFVDRSFAETDDDPDVTINSQPLQFLLGNPFGLQTLGVSARYRLAGPSPRWKRLRILMALENAEIYLRPKHLANRRTLSYLATRAKGGANQLAYQVRRM